MWEGSAEKKTDRESDVLKKTKHSRSFQKNEGGLLFSSCDFLRKKIQNTIFDRKTKGTECFDKK